MHPCLLVRDNRFLLLLSFHVLQDSNVGESGVGYEEVIKSTYGGIYGAPTGTVKGTKKVKATKKK